MDTVSDLRGMTVVSIEEGARLGTVNRVYIDPDTRALCAMEFYTKPLRRHDMFIPMDAVNKVGKDVVLVATDTAAREVTEQERPPGRSLKELRGAGVITKSGERLGALTDIEVGSGWKITELLIDDDKVLPVSADELALGDEIVVPADAREHLRKNEHPKRGLLRRILRSDEEESSGDEQ